MKTVISIVAMTAVALVWSIAWTGCKAGGTEPASSPNATSPTTTLIGQESGEGAEEGSGAGADDASGSDPAAAPDTAPSTGARTVAVAADAALYARVEGASANNACSADSDCMPSGCSKEVCAAEQVMTSCEIREWPQGEGATCGCVAGSCVWYR